MTSIEDKEKLEILLNKATVYLRFSLSFTAISFPLIFLSLPKSFQDIPELILILPSLLSFVISVIFSFFSFNGLNSLKENYDPESKIIGILFYSNLLDIAYFANISGFFLIVLYLSFLITNSIPMLILIAGGIAFCFIIIKLMRKYVLYEKEYKRVGIFMILGFITILIIGIIILILTL